MLLSGAIKTVVDVWDFYWIHHKTITVTITTTMTTDYWLSLPHYRLDSWFPLVEEEEDEHEIHDQPGHSQPGVQSLVTRALASLNTSTSHSVGLKEIFPNIRHNYNYTILNYYFRSSKLTEVIFWLSLRVRVSGVQEVGSRCGHWKCWITNCLFKCFPTIVMSDNINIKTGIWVHWCAHVGVNGRDVSGHSKENWPT